VLVEFEHDQHVAYPDTYGLAEKFVGVKAELEVADAALAE